MINSKYPVSRFALSKIQIDKRFLLAIGLLAIVLAFSLKPVQPTRSFILQGGSAATVKSAVIQAGGVVTHELELIDGVAAQLTEAQHASLGSHTAIASIFADEEVRSDSAVETMRDEFNAVAYSNNDGTRNWASPWIESPEENGPGKGQVKIRKDQLWIKNSGYEVRRSADLSDATAATLQYEFKRFRF